PGPRRIGWYVSVGLVGCLAATHLVHAWAAAHYDVSIMAFSRYLPLFYPLRNPGLLARLGLVDRAAARERGAAASLQTSPPHAPRGGALPLPVAPPSLTAPAGPYKIPGVRARPQARRRLAPGDRAGARTVRPSRGPLRPPLQRRQYVENRPLLALLRHPR